MHEKIKKLLGAISPFKAQRAQFAANLPAVIEPAPSHAALPAPAPDPRDSFPPTSFRYGDRPGRIYVSAGRLSPPRPELPDGELWVPKSGEKWRWYHDDPMP